MSERTMSTGAGAAFAGDSIDPVYLAELDFESGFVRLFTGIGTIEWNGHTWTGCGVLGTVGDLEETMESRAVGVKLTLSGVGDPITVDGEEIDVLAIMHGENWQQRTARIYYGLLRENMTWAIEPFQVSKKMMDDALIDEEKGEVQLNLESLHFDLERAEVLRFTAEAQRALYPGDRGCDQVAALQEKSVTWNLG